MDGLIIVDKPKDMTSRDVVNIISKKFNTKKVGHTGTLDPNATGVLVIALGKALKIVDLITSLDKTYIAEVILGKETDTLDITGNITLEKDFKIEKEEIIKVLKFFLGKQKQIVPKYSAVKVNGKRLYEYARENIEVELPIREVEINSLELLNLNENGFEIKTNVSKGTYIRSLIRDIGLKLNTVACMGNLRRVKQGEYLIENSYSLEDIENDNYEIISLFEALKDYEFIKATKEEEIKVLNGAIMDFEFKGDICIIVNSENKVIAIYEKYKDRAKPRNVFR